ncbi:ribonuclease D [Tautonia sociabilis]|uniref:Ribonuclease D n=1 Tax=Tautonia sociabilis TaxID=2080755 RepID=A0A432MQQ0_9BACT|nr:ribonuclease D [Tautonia sociabilis]RUL89772.1 ribonuclease D [Tautonia sociabilis]
MPGRHVAPLIATEYELRELVAHLRDQGRFAFDTEFVSEDTFEPVLCLAQVATRERMVAIDPLARGLDLEPLWDAVLDPKLEVVMHAAGEDLRICRLQTGRLPSRVFDTQVAAGLAGFGYPMSLVNLVGQALGIPLSGSETRTDWRRRPLSEAQVSYALDDVAHLLDLADFLRGRLDSWGRSAWAEDEFAAFVASVRRRVEEDRWRRLPGAGTLSRRSLEVARRLYDWRIEEARASNRPIRQVMRDDLLVGIARRQPRTKRDLEALRDFNRPHLVARSREILDVVAEALLVPEDRLPEPSERPDDLPGMPMLTSLLNATLAHCAARYQISTGLVGSSNDLKALVRWHLDGRPDQLAPDLLRGWRADVCGRALLDVLSGRLALRIDDLGSEVPVALEPVPPHPPAATDSPDGSP